MPAIPDTCARGRTRMITSSRTIWAKVSKTLSQKKNTNKRAGYVDQMVKHLYTILKALVLVLSTVKNIAKQTKKEKVRKKINP
jgi:hypothetical protein